MIRKLCTLQGSRPTPAELLLCSPPPLACRLYGMLCFGHTSHPYNFTITTGSTTTATTTCNFTITTGSTIRRRRLHDVTTGSTTTTTTCTFTITNNYVRSTTWSINYVGIPLREGKIVGGSLCRDRFADVPFMMILALHFFHHRLRATLA